MTKSKNDIAWELLFSKYQILSKIEEIGYFVITSNQINEFREARLMTKFDHRSQQSEIFQKHNLSILPISRGSYEIGKFETFQDFENNHIETQKITFPSHLESLSQQDITSESTAINCASYLEYLKTLHKRKIWYLP